MHSQCGRQCEVYQCDFDQAQLTITKRGQIVIDELPHLSEEEIERALYVEYGFRVDH